MSVTIAMNENHCFLTKTWVKIEVFFYVPLQDSFFFKALKVGYINQINISKILFMLCPVFQEVNLLHFLRKLKDCLPYSEAIVFFFCSGLLSLEGCGGLWGVCLLDCSWQSKKSSFSLSSSCVWTSVELWTGKTTCYMYCRCAKKKFFCGYGLFEQQLWNRDDK